MGYYADSLSCCVTCKSGHTATVVAGYQIKKYILHHSKVFKYFLYWFNFIKRT